MASYIRTSGTNTILEIHVVPGASRTAVRGLHGDRLKIALSAPATEGRANGELISFLSKLLSVPRRNISIFKGELSRAKSVAIDGVQLSYVESRLAEVGV